MSKLLNVSSSPHVRSHETTHSIMLDAVSYTHLDVYKRQVFSFPSGKGGDS